MFGGADPAQPAFFDSLIGHIDTVRRRQQRVATSSGGKSIIWIGTHGADIGDYRVAASLIGQGSGGLNNLLSNLVTDRVSLSDLPGLFNRTEGSESFGKILVLPD